MSNVISLATRKAAPNPAKPPFSRTDSLAPHLFEPGRERDGAIFVALTLAQSHAHPASCMPRNPIEALRKTRRALAILEIECAELAYARTALPEAEKIGGRT